MRWSFNKTISHRNSLAAAFSLVEVSVALVILAIIISSVLVIMNRCIDSVIDSRLKIEAFELARENMEKLLASSSVKEQVDFGISETNPDMKWETDIENFYEPTTKRMWIKAVCSASYSDSKDEEQKVELQHWLTSLSKKQMLQILEQDARKKAYETGLMTLDEYNSDQGVDIELSYAQSLIGQEISYVKEDGSTGTTVVKDVKVIDDKIVMNPGENSVPLENVPNIDTKVNGYEAKHPELLQEPKAQENNDSYGLGPPPEGYSDWSSVPFNILLKRFMEKLNSK